MIRLRPASLDDVPLLRHWEEDPDVVSSDPNDDWRWEEELAEIPDWREPLIGEEDGRPVGFVDIIDPDREESGYWGEVPPGLRAIDIWIGAPGDRGRGLGTELMRQAIAKCFAPDDVTAIVIDPLASNVRAIRFYERLGFRAVERRTFGEDDCLVMRLDRRGS
ncbi:MAG: acetyltransferase [Gemmatimonadetes bacterium]|nr:acetyltransferase [Gemmatimonadota bacterium]